MPAAAAIGGRGLMAKGRREMIPSALGFWQSWPCPWPIDRPMRQGRFFLFGLPRRCRRLQGGRPALQEGPALIDIALRLLEQGVGSIRVDQFQRALAVFAEGILVKAESRLFGVDDQRVFALIFELRVKEDCRGDFSGDIIHVGDHQQQPL